MNPTPPPARWPWALLGWLAFVVYGSLLPLDWQPLPWHLALDRLAAAPWHDFDVRQRADWVANGVLYAPLGLLLARQAVGHGRVRLVALVLAWAVGLALALALELAQLAFPPRSVSRNDLLAEAIGAGLGVLAWPVLRHRLGRWRAGWQAGGAPLAAALLGAYALALPVLSLFPYDFLVAATEWHDKLASDRWGLAWAGEASWRRRALQLGFEAVLALPLGAWAVQRHRPEAPGLGWGRGLAVGLAFGLAIEIGQLATATGMSQGASVLSRALGAAAGAAAWWRLGYPGLAAVLHRWRWPLGLGWLALLLVASGYGRLRWQGPEAAAAVWTALKLAPFHYHYFTTEAQALGSLVRVALAYAPAALVAAALARGPWAAAAAAAALAAALEGGKLLLAGARPDPTHVWIAAAAAGIGRALLARLGQSPAPGRPQPAGRSAGLGPPAWPAGAAPAALVLVLAWVGAQAWHFPSAGPWLLAVLAVAAGAVAWRPAWALTLLPLAVPLDLAMWSGRTLWDEFDLLLLTVVAVALWRTSPPARPGPAGGVDRAADALAAAWLLSLLLAALIGAAHSTAGPATSAGWWGAAGAWRVLKGALGAAATLWLWHRLAGDDAQASRRFEQGVALACGVVVASVLWERAAFASLLDTRSAYRVTGPFASMLRGGAYVEGFLAVGWACTLARVWRAPGLPARLAWAALAAGTGYALAVTWSRGGWWAGGLAAAVMLVALWRGARVAPRDTPPAGRALAVSAAGLGLAAALPFLVSPLAGQRLALWDEDLEARVAHWHDAWSIRQPGPAALAFGSGLGGFPEAHAWRSREARHAGGMAILSEPGNRYLRLGKGEANYVEQWVALAPGAPVVVTLRLRAPAPSAGPGTGLSIGICEKWMLTSLRCAKVVARPPPGADAGAAAWADLRLVLPTTSLAPARRPLERPLKFAVWLEGQGPLDVDDLRIEGAGVGAALPNGGFESGWDHWLFATDVAPPWQIDNLPLAVLWQQGALGLAALAGLVALAAVRGARRLWAGDATAAAPLAALVGLAGLGCVSTLIDAPRFLWLLMVLLWWCGRRPALATGVARPAV